jgi:DNA-binding GntR family transcriptional regulator
VTEVITAQEGVLRELRTLIAAGKLSPGQQVVQDSLAATLGVSRVPLREALKVLEGEGQVIYHPHRGYFVADLSIADLVEVYRIRSILEDEALRVGVPLLTDEDLDYLEGLIQDVEAAAKSADVTAVTSANRRFHFALFESSNMPRLVRLIRNQWDATDAYRGVYFAAASNLDHMNSEHRAMLVALRDRDVEKSIALQAAHRENSVAVVSQVISKPE